MLPVCMFSELTIALHNPTVVLFLGLVHLSYFQLSPVARHLCVGLRPLGLFLVQFEIFTGIILV